MRAHNSSLLWRQEQHTCEASLGYVMQILSQGRKIKESFSCGGVGEKDPHRLRDVTTCSVAVVLFGQG